MLKKEKIICIVGPTASGKSSLGILLAKKFSAKGGPASGWNGAEIISADSRQVYKGMDIGSGKVTKMEMSGVPHHMLDVASPRTRYSVAQYQRDAKRVLDDIFKGGKLPIVVGGTGLYVDALIFDKQLPEVPPDTALRKKLEKLSTEKMFSMLQKLDSRRASEIDRHNPRRLIRAIEIAKVLGKVPESSINSSKYDVLWIGLKPTDTILKKNIHIRLFARIRGIEREVKKFRQGGLSWRKLESFGLEYKYFALYLQGKIQKKDMLEKLETEINRYAKRQYTWFKRNKDINWFTPNQTREIEKETTKFCY